MPFDEFSKWYDFMNEQGMADIVDSDTFDESEELDEKSEISNKFWEADDIIQQLQIITQKNSDSSYTSQFFDTNEISQRISAEDKSGNII
ncbi:5886_t:CDS:1, partial [Dentiscutata heterogama]